MKLLPYVGKKYCNLLFLGVQSGCIQLIIFFGCLASRDGDKLEGNEMKKLFSRLKDESGQALVLVAVSLVVILGATAFSVDVGMAFNAKAKLQAAADAAALAGAQDLPSSSVAVASAENYAGLNGVQVDEVQVVTPYNGNLNRIEVTCTQQFEYFFAKVLGFYTKDIVVRAVAEKNPQWEGDALPFMNLDDNYSVNPNMTLWEKTTNAGDDEKLWPYDQNKIDAEYEITESDGLFSCMLVDMEDGFALKSGITRNDQDEIEGVVLQSLGQQVYVLSLKPGVINPDTNYNNKQNISIHDVVLLKCTVVSYDFQNANSFGIDLHYDGVFYNFYDVVTGGVIVPGLNNNGGANIKLIE